ncbi:winged helix-turn-helix transcriptional regulator [Gryllotalpicola protaetiae]|uniref:Transcriptional regulator n=1 Tax=Gryllotalpicola protaetiae TaxID=2419771 RepID=A0A387BSA7_9MICO|nr:winged helix-turn-helix transcriptional regulator [Gryllotalpicola protaetiae]AYG05472.1 transcriptional regulator [Gryllotalpicola protaetiae]
MISIDPSPDSPSSHHAADEATEQPPQHLQRDLGVPTNILATRLRELEAAGVLSRLPLRHNTRAYALTDRGFALREAIIALGRWGAEEDLS